MSKELRSYQREALYRLNSALCADTGNYLFHLGEGGGKTWVAVDLVADRLVSDFRVLWIAPSWTLLKQAFAAVRERAPDVSHKAVRLGGKRDSIHHQVTERSGGFVYTTVHTLGERLVRGTLPTWVQPDLIIWDEAHWAQRATTGQRILGWAASNRCCIVGMTATPLPDSASGFRTIYSRSFVELVNEGYLARPEIGGNVHTGIDWSPRISGAQGDFRSESLTVLARSERRNSLIVRQYLAEATEYGRTLLFACNIQHAITLADMFSANGVPARPVHSHQGERTNDKYLEQFRTGAVQVLVTVEKLTHGFDLPALQTIFLCRPTTSDILYSQMVGRGSRLHEESGKKTFKIVEFTDNLTRFSDQLRNAKSLFEGSASSNVRSRTSRKPVGGIHGYDPDGAPTWIPDSNDIPDEVRGLSYRENQTFGIEFELTAPLFATMDSRAWTRKAEMLRSKLEQALGARRVVWSVNEPVCNSDCTRWRVVRDGSCGWEVLTPVLWNKDGFLEVVRACQAIDEAAEEAGLCVNFKTGTHVHLGWPDPNPAQLKHLLILVGLMEPGLGTLVAPSRCIHFQGRSYNHNLPNTYCGPVSAVYKVSEIRTARTVAELQALSNSATSKYVSLNIRPLNTLRTVEVRLHNGTLDARKILLWVSLWQQILFAAEKGEILVPAPDRSVIVPDGDIIALVQEHLPLVQPPGFLEKLKARRREILGRWLQHPDLSRWVAFAQNWHPLERAA